MREFKRWAWLLSILPLSSSLPALATDANQDLVDINVPMTEIGYLLEQTLPLVYNDKAFYDPSNSALIKARLADLRTHFKAAEPHLKQKSLGYKISAEVLMDQLASAQQAFDRGESSLTQHILKGLPSVCMSCHIQDHKQNTLFQHVNLEAFKTEFAKAEVSFVIRDYKHALEHYQSFLKEPKHSANQQLKALERMLVIYSDIYKKPKEIYDHLLEYQKSKTLHASVKQTLSGWLEGLKEYINTSGLMGDGVDYNQLDNYMMQHYTKIENEWVPVLNQDKDKIFYIMLRASLYAYLNENPPKQQIPALLYWLAVCDRSLEYNFYFSLADWYLKECITHYSSDPYAEKCYQAYEDYVTYAYTGSRGTEIPPDILRELSVLKETVRKANTQMGTS